MTDQLATANQAPPARTRPQIAVEGTEKGPGKLLVVSIAAHVAIALALGAAEVKKIRAATAIEIADVPQKPKAPPPEPPSPPPKREPRPAQRAPEPAATPAPNPAAEPAGATAGLDGLPDFGLSLSSGSGPGIPLRAGPRAAPSAPVPVARRAAVQAPQRPGCEEAALKPRAKLVPQPVYGDAARAAGVEGKVRVELTIDELGKVVAVRLLAGLGHGLDEAVLAAAQRAEFEPARRCGTAVRGTFLLSMRFAASG